jgi:hypothetical protein
MDRQHHMPNLKSWRRALIATHGEVQGAFLTAQVQARYDTFYKERSHFTHPALRRHLEQQILPGLALYQVLSQERKPREEVLAEVGSLLALGSASRAFSTVAKLHSHLPLPFALFRRLLHIALRAFPSQGWNIDQLEESHTHITFTVHRCFYLDVLTCYGAPELTAAYCQLDDRAYVALSPSLRWERTKTLGRGDVCCNFRWSRGKLG